MKPNHDQQRPSVDRQAPGNPGASDRPRVWSADAATPRAPGKRLRVRRAILSALAGGGLTAVGLSGPLSGGALAAEAQTGSTTSTTPTETSTTPAPSTPSQTTTTSTTGTSTTPEPGTTTTAGTTTTPAPADGTSTVTTTTPTSAAEAAQPPVGALKVVVQHTQQTTEGEAAGSTTAATTKATTPASSEDIAGAPQLASAEAGALAAMLADSAASTQALSFYRIPLFLLPIYQAAAVQYGVPWEVLAAINEVETDFGTDLSVSSAGAVGWMQFMPETWLQYGVDALGAGYADPYNPVDAVFAAARYLHAAGASTDLRAAILAYNHSEAYVESVLLRARLFASYPPSVIATLTGLTEGSTPVAGAQLSASSIAPQSGVSDGTTTSGASGATTPGASADATAAGAGSSSATAGSALTAPLASTAQAHTALPGSTLAPSPAAVAADTERALNAASPPSQLSRLVGRAHAPVVAVEDGRVVAIGHSRKLGRYLVLRDTYGDVFTYAGLGSIAPRYRLPKPAQVEVPKGALTGGESGSDPAPKEAASAGHQLPLTLHVAKKTATPAGSKQASGSASRSGQADSAVTGSSGQAEASEAPGAEAGKVRVYAHPDNPDATVAVARAKARNAALKEAADGWMPLRRGSVVAQGTVLGHLGSNGESADATLRFAIRPAGAQSAIDPRPILENWRQLAIALHPQGAKDGLVLAGATASDAFLLSKTELQSAVLDDPGIKLGACDRAQVAAGKVGRQALALLVFLSRSGLKPTVGELRCGRATHTAQGLVTTFPQPDTLDISAVNGIPIAGHQGAGTITDITIRTLLTIQPRFAPRRIVSLMQYPGAPSTVADANYSSFIKVELAKAGGAAAKSKTAGGAAAHAATAGQSATVAAQANITLNTAEWQRLIAQVGGLLTPKLSSKPSASAIRDKGLSR